MTISNDDELRQALEALGDLRLALASLKRDVGRTNPRNFGVMAEGTLDELTRIESEVNEYLGIDPSDSTRHGTMISDVGDDNTGEV